MPSEDDRTYFARRAREERAKAEQANEPIGYKVHTEMARQYERRILTVLRLKAQ